MEDTLGVSDIKNVRIFIDGLNPCSNGRYSRSVLIFLCPSCQMALNPCSNGRYSRRVRGVKALFQAGGRVVRLIKLSFVNRS